MSISPNINNRQFESFVEDPYDGGTNRRVIIKDIDPSVSIPIGAASHTSVAIIYYQHSTPVTTSAYTEILSSTSDVINNLQIFDSSGQMLVLAVGAIGAEVNKLLIFPGGNGSVDLTIPASSRLSVMAVTGDTAAGYLAITGIK